jgi:hypothetical protein
VPLNALVEITDEKTISLWGFFIGSFALVVPEIVFI